MRGAGAQHTACLISLVRELFYQNFLIRFGNDAHDKDSNIGLGPLRNTGRRQPNHESILPARVISMMITCRRGTSCISKVLDNFVNQISLRHVSITTYEASGVGHCLVGPS